MLKVCRLQWSSGDVKVSDTNCIDTAVAQRLVTQQNEAALREFFRCFVYAETDNVVEQLRTLRARLRV